MRVRYTFTSDVEDAPDKVKYNLEYFKQQENSLDKSLKNIINKLTNYWIPVVNGIILIITIYFLIIFKKE